jgi:hypothetical protein
MGKPSINLQGKRTDQTHQIKVKACGVCGTDLHIHEGEFKSLTLGPMAATTPTVSWPGIRGNYDLVRTPMHN